MAEAVYGDAADRADLKRFLDEQGGVVADTPRDMKVEGNDTSGYIGVSAEYMTYSNDTEKPLVAEGGVIADHEQELRDDQNAEDLKVVPRTGISTMSVDPRDNPPAPVSPAPDAPSAPTPVHTTVKSPTTGKSTSS